MLFYYRLLTWLWTLYFFVKALVYAWIGSRYTLEAAIAIRSVAGTASLYAMIGASMFLAGPILKTLGRFRLLPSQRAADNG